MSIDTEFLRRCLDTLEHSLKELKRSDPDETENRKGRPFTSYEAVVNLIGSAAPRKGLIIA